MTDETGRPRKRQAPGRLPEKLKAIRRKLGLTQGEMMVRINPDDENAELSRARISQYELGHRTPSLIEVWNYAKAGGIVIEYLINDDLDLPF